RPVRSAGGGLPGVGAAARRAGGRLAAVLGRGARAGRGAAPAADGSDGAVRVAGELRAGADRVGGGSARTPPEDLIAAALAGGRSGAGRSCWSRRSSCG